MTDTSKLSAEATAISKNSSVIRAFALDAAANLVQQAARIAALEKTVTALVLAGQPEPPPVVTPSAQTGTGLGLLMYRGALNICSHLTDGTYDLVIGSWGDPVLPSCSGEQYAYTVTAGTPGADPTFYTVLDPANPAAYLAKTATLPPGVGVFLDNGLYAIPGLLTALQTVSVGLKAQGRRICVNAGAFVSGDPRSDTGELWAIWAKQLVPYVDRIFCENWQQMAGGTMAGQPRPRGTDLPWKHWDTWQLCVPACQGKFVGMTYAETGGLANAVYGRASQMVAGAGAFIYNTGRGGNTGTTDPYDPVWTKVSVSPSVNPVAPVSAIL